MVGAKGCYQIYICRATHRSNIGPEIFTKLNSKGADTADAP